MQHYRIDKPFILTIFGASGDLARLKIFPALYALIEQKRFPQNFFIVGFARTKKTRQEFQHEFEKSIFAHVKGSINKALVHELVEKVQYFTGDYSRYNDFVKYRAWLAELTGNTKLAHIAYFSVPPHIFQPIIKNLGETKKNTHEDIRLVFEKPFGTDVASATELFHFVARYFEEDQVYLLDHYLGKTAVQSILQMRHANRFLNLIMKGTEVANIQITASENFGVKDRVGYFDQVGVLKDMVQSHLLQVLALIAMSIPITEHAVSLHREKYSILSALKFPQSKNNIVLGQYESYRKTKGIVPHSKTDTFVAVRLFVDRESWYKVPIYIRTGKMLHEKHTYVVVELKKFAFQDASEAPNRIIIELYPDEKISITLVNLYGGKQHVQNIITSNTLACAGDDCLPEHGLLLLDVIRGRRLNFLSFPEVIATWQLIDSIAHYVKKTNAPVTVYPDKSDGPEAQNNLTKIDGFKWFDVH